MTTKPAPTRRLGDDCLWHLAWAAVFMVNLAFPIVLALRMVGVRGAIGMVLAIGLLWLLGDLEGVRRPALRRVLLTGGLIVALAQFFPLLQLAAGFVGLWVSTEFFPEQMLIPPDRPLRRPILTPVGAFVATFVTGDLLILASFILGLLYRLIFRPRPAKPAPPTGIRDDL